MVAKLQSTGVKAASAGIGKVINIKNAFGLGPTVPVLAPTRMAGAKIPAAFKGAAYFDGTATVAMTAGTNEKIYYTTDGSNPTYSNGFAGVNCVEYSSPIPLSTTIAKKNKITIKAISVNIAGKASKVVTASYNVLTPVISVSVTGASTLSVGKSTQLSAMVMPAIANDKKITWSIVGTAPSGVTLSAGGKLTAAKTASVGLVTVKAAAVDGSEVYDDTFTISVLNAISSVNIDGSDVVAAGKSITLKAVTTPVDFADQKMAWSLVGSGDETRGTIHPTSGKITLAKGVNSGTLTVKAKSNAGGIESAPYVVTISGAPATSVTISLTSLVLYPYNSSQLTASALGDTASPKVLWTTSNAKIATVDSSGLVIAHTPGSVKITATAADGSGKKAVCSVKVNTPPVGMNILASDELGYGKTLSPKVVFIMQQPTVKTVTWSAEGANASLVNVNPKSGKMTITSNSFAAGTSVDLVATWNDGGSVLPLKVTYPVKLYPELVKTLKMTSAATVDILTHNPAGQTGKTSAQLTVSTQEGAPNASPNVTWVSSNDKVATVNAFGVVSAVRVGKVRITATAKDGSGKKAVTNVNVNVPASRITIFSNLTTRYADHELSSRSYSLAYGKSMTLKAAHGTVYGVPTNKSVTWEIVSADAGLAPYLSLSKTGKLSASGKGTSLGFKSAIIKATANDGSGVSATVQVDFERPTTKFDYALVQGTKLYAFSSISHKTVPYGSTNTVVYVSNGMKDFTLTSSNPDSVRADFTYVKVGLDTYRAVELTYMKAGSSTIKVTANDGTNKSFSFKVSVGTVS